MTTPLFPVFLKMDDRNCLVVGGGPVAERKTTALMKSKAKLTVVAPQVTENLAQLAEQGQINWFREVYREEHLQKQHFVFVATSNESLNQDIAMQCRRREIPVNVADTPDLCSFYLPAVVDRFPLQIAISTNGASPALASWIRSRLELLFPPTYATLTRALGCLRPWVKKQLPEATSRLKFWHKLLDSSEMQDILHGQRSFFPTETRRRIARQSTNQKGKVYLVGAGPGDPELLTVKAHRLLQQADVVVHDHLITEEILACVRKEAERIHVGKTCGGPSHAQSDIQELLIQLARQGKIVVRLKGGDPFIFGRGGEEVEALHRAGILFEVVPGITAALGCAAALNIPLTHRQMAQSVVFLTGHLTDKGDLAEKFPLLQPHQTLVIYMGLSNLKSISEILRKQGFGQTPAALIQSGTTNKQKSLVGVVNDLPQMASLGRFSSPVLVMVGDVVRFQEIHRSLSPEVESLSERAFG